jgi:hypothetical protein
MVTKNRGPRERPADAVAPDRGCQYASRCVLCPWSECIKELPAAEHLSFVAALRLVRRYLPAVDRATSP